MRDLDRSRSYVADAGSTASPRIAGVRLAARSAITAAITIQASAQARPGDRYQLDVIQHDGAGVVGGSTYEIVVIAAAEG